MGGHLCTVAVLDCSLVMRLPRWDINEANILKMLSIQDLCTCIYIIVQSEGKKQKGFSETN